MSRLMLASCSLLAMWLDPTEVQQYGFVVDSSPDATRLQITFTVVSQGA